MTLKLTLLSTALLTGLAFPAAAVVQFNSAGLNTTATAVSGDGSTVVGLDANGKTYRWTKTGGVELLDIAPPSGLSHDGTVIVGTTAVGTPIAYRWTNGTTQGVTPLGTPSSALPAYARALAISGDGNTVIGTSSSTNTSSQSYKWSAGVTTSLGDLTGGAISSIAHGISTDGSVIAGESQSANGREAFVYKNGTMTGLGDIASGAFASTALGVSPDGGTVVGWGSTSVLGVAKTLGFRWTSTAGMTILPQTAAAQGSGITFTNMQANAVSTGGTVIVGYVTKQSTITNSDGTKTTTTLNAGCAWFGGNIKRISELLAVNGFPTAVDEVFGEVTGVSEDADTIVGNGKVGSYIITGARPLFGLAALPSTSVTLPVKVTVASPGAGTQLTYDTIPGQVYQLQRSTDLSTWTNVGDAYSTADLGAGATGPHTTTDSTNSASAYYRVSVQIAPPKS